MVKMKINNFEVQVEEYWTILEAAKFYGIEIPTLCYREGLTPYGACRLCVVEIGPPGRSKLVSSCTYPVQEGLEVRTDSERVDLERAEIRLPARAQRRNPDRPPPDGSGRDRARGVRRRRRHGVR